MIALLAVACNRYDLFVIEDGRGVRPNQADVLFVIDNSDSMFEESVGLAENFSRFVEQLAARGQGYGTDGLPDAVDKYVDYVQNPAYFVDFQLAITTIDARADGGALRGTVLDKDDPNLADRFVETLMCDATCFADRRAVGTDPDYQCGDPFPGTISQQFLDCVCGQDAWIDHCGGGTEEGLESVYDAMCRAVDDPPAACFDADSPLTADAAGTNAGLIRPGSTVIPVVVTDEGDASRRMAAVDSLPAPYIDLFAELEVPTAWAVIGPSLTDEFELACPGLATSWGTLRYEYMVQKTGGLKLDIHAPDCEGGVDWGVALQQLGNLVGGGVRAYPLPREPVPTSIVVEVGGRTIDPAVGRGEDVFGEPVYTDGWSYDPVGFTVILHGAEVPDPGEQIRIWYLPR
ncbi:MAG: hypothetical protein ABMB14_20340 [Myxococcota bacterium]